VEACARHSHYGLCRRRRRGSPARSVPEGDRCPRGKEGTAQDRPTRHRRGRWGKLFLSCSVGYRATASKSLFGQFQKACSRKSIYRILDNLESRHHNSSLEPQPRRVAWHNILEACIKMRFFGFSTAGDERRSSTDSLSIKDTEPLPRSASHSRTGSVRQGSYVRQ
jgi:hypothetical protein